MHPAELRVAALDGHPQGRVERVDRAVALGGADDPLAAHVHLHGGLGGEALRDQLVGDHPERLHGEPVLLPAAGSAHEELQGAVGGLEVVPLVLQVLQRLEHLAQLLAAQLEPELGRLQLQGGAAGQLGHHEAGAVAHGVGDHVLVGVAPPGDGRRVEARLVGERRRPHVGGLRVRCDVHELGDVVADRGEQPQPVGGQGAHAHLEGEVRDDRRQVAVARALAVAVYRALHVAGTAPHAGEGVGHAAAGVVVQVHADRDVVAEVPDDPAHDVLHVVGKGAAVGVAEHQRARTPLGGRLQHPQAELRVALVAVEEVLGVEQHLQTGGPQEPDRVGHHGHALVERGAQRLGDVVVPALPHDADGRHVGLHQVGQGLVVVDPALHPAGRAEGHQRARLEVELRRGPPEELLVLRVGARPAPLDVVHAEVVELLGDAQLVVDGERDALQLAPVAQRGVEDLHGVGLERGALGQHDAGGAVSR